MKAHNSPFRSLRSGSPAHVDSKVLARRAFQSSVFTGRSSSVGRLEVYKLRKPPTFRGVSLLYISLNLVSLDLEFQCLVSTISATQ